MRRSRLPSGSQPRGRHDLQRRSSLTPRKTRLSLLAAAALLAAFPIRIDAAKSAAPVPTSARKGFQRSSTATRGGAWEAGVKAANFEHLEAILTSPKAIVVSKSAKTLTLFKNGEAVKTYPVAVGRSANGAKQKAGDWRTPEGLYYVAQHHPGSRFHRALKISYPNMEDAERGLAGGLINPIQADRIKAAITAGVLPPQNTRLGYNIEIHGGYKPAPDGGIRGYTRGCVAVTNPMIREIYHWAPVGTPVLITGG